ncbi:MAG: C4-dicarboxylate ABC transporter substrate-binding protein [Deltaproteobacteria bacterium HGW-Deltaproteobacteria-2]|nr:MAG: C4-dicarboxylate ABC transporter substrate-binding protein [Deltaproteobacteria bacterium HGW-Deltaproteobacteria-2]
MKDRKVVRLLWKVLVLFSFCSIFLFQEAWAIDNVKQIKNGKTVYVLKMGTLAPNGVGWAALIKTIIAPGITKATNGEVKLDWYYGGTMGDDQDIIAKMRNGQLHGGGFSGQGTIMACPEMSLIELPFMFDNYQEVEYVYAKLRPRISQWYEKRGYHLFLLAEQDFDQIYSVKHEIRKPDDFKDVKIVTWNGLLEERSLKAIGASPVPVRVPEIASSYHTGVIDASVSPAIWIVGTQMYTIAKYVNTARIRYSPAIGIISLMAWNQLPKEHQVAIDNFMATIEKGFRQRVRDDNEECLKAMYKYGLKETKMTRAEIDVFKKRLLPVWDEFAEKGYYTKAELAELKGILAEYRNKNRK